MLIWLAEGEPGENWQEESLDGRDFGKNKLTQHTTQASDPSVCSLLLATSDRQGSCSC